LGWVYLLAAILLEVAGTTSMKLSEGFTKLGPSVAIFVFYGLAFVLLTLALKSFDVSVAYAVWSGLGVAVISLVGILYFQEPVTALKVGSLLLIVAGVAGLNAGGAH
jgi:small multidrug resistance pump